MQGDTIQLGFGADDQSGPGGNSQAFEFTITNGLVTGLQRVEGTTTVSVRIPTDATFQVGTGRVTETLTGTHDTRVVTYTAESANPSLYQVTAITDTPSTPTTVSTNGDTHGISFTITAGLVTAEQASFSDGTHSQSVNLPIPPDATFTVGTGTVTETLVEGNSVETLHYVQPTGQTLYALSSETTSFIPQGSATTTLSVDPLERAMFTIGTGGTVTAVEAVEFNGSTKAITPDSHTTFTQIAPGFVEENTTLGSTSHYEIFYAGANSDGIYTAVAHGSGTVDLVGLQSQLAELPTAQGTHI